MATELDWAAKHQLVTRYCQLHGTDLTDPRVTRLTLAYHDVSPEQGLRQRLENTGMLRARICVVRLSPGLRTFAET